MREASSPTWQATNRPKYLNQLMKEVSTFLCYEATADLQLGPCKVQTCVGNETGLRLTDRVGIVPVLRGGLGMVEAMTEMVSNAQVAPHARRRRRSSADWPA